MKQVSDISIIGNGVLGKAAALGFAQAGLSVTLLGSSSIEPPKNLSESESVWDVRVYALNQATQALLSSLRVWEAMDSSRIVAVDAMTIKGDDKRNAGLLFFDAYRTRVKSLAWIVEDKNLHCALDAALRFARHVQI